MDRVATRSLAHSNQGEEAYLEVPYYAGRTHNLYPIAKATHKKLLATTKSCFGQIGCVCRTLPKWLNAAHTAFNHSRQTRALLTYPKGRSTVQTTAFFFFSLKIHPVLHLSTSPPIHSPPPQTISSQPGHTFELDKAVPVAEYHHCILRQETSSFPSRDRP